MADKRKGKMKKMSEEEKPTKEEYAVAKYLRFGLDTRDGKLHGMEVKCFMGNAAVDKLMDSKWSSTKNQKDPIFTNRAVCVAYMVRLLEKGLFHRAEKEKRKKDKEKEKAKRRIEKKEESATNTDDGVRERKGKKSKKSLKEKENENGKDEAEKKEDDKEDKKKQEEEKKKQEEKEKKRREKVLKLIMPDMQYFEDGNDVYVWIYDPVNAKNFIIGLLMVLGAIGLCMFPLWPDELRIGVYYLSLCAGGFVGFILTLVVIRLILFCCIWLITFGHHHFWLLPNLTEDVGFFDSFRPLYHHERMKSEESKSSEGKKKKKKKSEIENTDKKEKSSDKEDSDEFEVIKKEDIEENEKGEKPTDVDEDEELDDNIEDENEDEELNDNMEEENDIESESEIDEEESKANKKTN